MVTNCTIAVTELAPHWRHNSLSVVGRSTAMCDVCVAAECGKSLRPLTRGSRPVPGFCRTRNIHPKIRLRLLLRLINYFCSGFLPCLIFWLSASRRQNCMLARNSISWLRSVVWLMRIWLTFTLIWLTDPFNPFTLALKIAFKNTDFLKNN